MNPNDEITLWSVGRNMPGYLPDSDEPTLCTTWESAKSSLLWEMDAQDDFLFEANREFEPRADEWKANLMRSAEDLHAATGPEWSDIVDDCPSGTIGFPPDHEVEVEMES